MKYLVTFIGGPNNLTQKLEVGAGPETGNIRVAVPNPIDAKYFNDPSFRHRGSDGRIGVTIFSQIANYELREVGNVAEFSGADRNFVAVFKGWER